MKIQFKYPCRNTFVLISFIIVFLNPFTSVCQECSYSVELQLKNINGGFFPGQEITLTNKTDGTIYTLNSDASGSALFKVPCNTIYNVTISNYTKKIEIKATEGGRLKRVLSYEANMVEKDKFFAMNDVQKNEVNQNAQQFADTTFISGSFMPAPKNVEYFVSVRITLKNIEGKPLTNEIVTITGVKRNKNVKVASDANGKILVFLFKGDTYTINFKYNKNYSTYDYPYSKGTLNSELSLSYLGTKEIEKRKKEEAIRILAEEKRLIEEKEMIAKECKALKITLEEWYRRDLIKKYDDTSDTVISTVLDRNKWFDKLIVCDLTGSMRPYTSQLSIWYQLNIKKEQNLQFVFFNDGNNTPDDKKIIGATGGIYYSSSKGSDSLTAIIAHVSARGYGGDCPENNMEALIKGVKMAKPFKELIAIVDNNSPVKDIELLKEFNLPLHIILCGASQGWILSDYLLMAWKTKGSIHTIEQDITNIARMSEGQEIEIGNITYRIMGGEFVRISKT